MASTAAKRRGDGAGGGTCHKVWTSPKVSLVDLFLNFNTISEIFLSDMELSVSREGSRAFAVRKYYTGSTD